MKNNIKMALDVSKCHYTDNEEKEYFEIGFNAPFKDEKTPFGDLIIPYDRSDRVTFYFRFAIKMDETRRSEIFEFLNELNVRASLSTMMIVGDAIYMRLVQKEPYCAELTSTYILMVMQNMMRDAYHLFPLIGEVMYGEVSANDAIKKFEEKME